MPSPVEFKPHVHHDKHPDLRGRKQIVARLLIARNLRARPTLQTGSRRGALKEVVKFAESEADSETRLNGPETLQQFVTGVLEQARQRGKTSPAHECLCHFEQDAHTMCCEHCVAHRLVGADNDTIKAAICDGHDDHDLPNLQHKALCWETFSELFKFAVNEAQRAYSEVLRGENSEYLEVELRTEITTNPGFGARTVFPAADKRGHRSAIVKLTLPREDFDDGYYLRLPYYLFHEVFVHAPEGWTAEGTRVPTNERCAFGEGFVDAAAVRVLTRALEAEAVVEGSEVQETPDRLHLPLTDRPYFERFMNEAEKAHHQRADLSASERSSSKMRDKALQDAADARDDGMRLFKRLARREDRRSADEAIRIALCVNLLPLEPEARIDFMTKLDRASSDQAAVSDKRSTWLQKLRDAANRGDLDQVRVLIEPVKDF
jgi:hypothetical protein